MPDWRETLSSLLSSQAFSLQLAACSACEGLLIRSPKISMKILIIKFAETSEKFQHSTRLTSKVIINLYYFCVEISVHFSVTVTWSWTVTHVLRTELFFQNKECFRAGLMVLLYFEKLWSRQWKCWTEPTPVENM